VNKVSKKKQEDSPVEGTVLEADMVELKRDMQSAKTMAWLQDNQQALIAAAVVLVLLLFGSALWKEQQLSQKHTAALLYMKANNTSDEAKRVALFESLVQEHASTGYATLAKLKMLGGNDVAAKKSALEALMNGEVAPEFAWQARLDLAELYIAEGDDDGAKTLLQTRVGKYYEQMRYYLLSQITSDRDEKQNLVQRALDAESNDSDLVAEMTAELALLKAAK